MAYLKLDLLIVIILLCFVAVHGGFNNKPDKIHENENAAVTIWSISADCDVQYNDTCYKTCTDWYNCFTDNIHDWGSWSCWNYWSSANCSYSCTKSKTVRCNTCRLTTYTTGLFELNGKNLVKKECLDPSCSKCDNSIGCLNYPEAHTIGVECWSTGYDVSDGRISTSVTVTTTPNNIPTFTLSEGSKINVYSGSSPVNKVVNTMIEADNDTYIDDDELHFSLISGPELSHVFGRKLFDLDGKEIKCISDLKPEFSFTFHMVLQVSDRRDQFSATLTISLRYIQYNTSSNTNNTLCPQTFLRSEGGSLLKVTWASQFHNALDTCYQTPNCTSLKDHIFNDTFGLSTGYGTTNSLFNMSYPGPSGHFLAFYSTWQGLSWSHEWVGDSLADSVAQDPKTGEISATTNISIWPAWPSKSYTMTVTIADSESCYNTTCDMDFTIFYTNWPIQHVSLPASREEHEDTDPEQQLHCLVLFDNNYAHEDNATCNITAIVPHEDNLFELRNEDNGHGLYAFDSWCLYKLNCTKPGCGYKKDNFLCEQNIGCLNHNLTQRYDIEITCWDAYDSNATETFTYNITANQPPRYFNLPINLVRDSDKVAHWDTVMSIMYSDAEGENLTYEYTYTPDHGFFIGDSWGNYYNNLGNITVTTYLHNLTLNETHIITVCGHERRNEICANLTLHLNNNCGAVPTCSDDTRVTDTEFSVGDVLFLIQVPDSSSFTGLTFYIASQHSDFFTVNTDTGEIQTTKALESVSGRQLYSIVAFVDAAGSCGYGSCTLLLYVDHVNYNISITNLPATIEIYEEATADEAIYEISTADTNTNDDVVCDVTDISPSSDVYYVSETHAGSNVWELMPHTSPGSKVFQYMITVNCSDNAGSSDTGQLTVNIRLNQAPRFTNLDQTTITVDPYLAQTGETIYTVSATDDEEDAISYACFPETTWIPFTCYDTASIVLRREVNFVTETNTSYSLHVCIGDAKHTNSSCDTLTVNFQSSEAYPSISNLADTSVEVAEDAALGTSVFTLQAVDLDDGDSHSFTLVAVDPDSGGLVFAVESTTGLISTAQSLDHESQSIYVLSFTVRDVTLTSTSTSSLTVLITDINEAPAISADTLTLSIDEDKAMGTLLPDPGLVCSDPDEGDRPTYSLIGGTDADYFSVGAYTGVLSVARLWDLEAGRPRTADLVVACTDSDGLSDTLAITVNIENVNEFTPTVTSSYTPGTVIQLSESTSLTENLLTLRATDGDVDDDGVFECNILRVGLGAEYFTIVAAAGGARRRRATGSSEFYLRLKKYPDFTYDKTFSFTITISDGEADPLFEGITVTVSYTAPNTTTTSQQPADKCLTCTTNGRVLVAAIVIEGLIVAMFVAHAIVSCCNLCPLTPLPSKQHDLVTRVRKSQPATRSTGDPAPVFNIKFGSRKAAHGESLAMTRMSARHVEVELSDSSSDTGSLSDVDDDITPSTCGGTRGHVSKTTNLRPTPVSASSSAFPPPVYSSKLSSAVINTERRADLTGLPAPIYAPRMS